MTSSTLAVHVKLQRFLHDNLQRYMPLSRDAAAVLKFRSIVRHRAIHAGDLQPYITPASSYRYPLSSKGLTLFLALAHPESRGLHKNQMGQLCGVLRPAENCQQHSRTILLHLQRHSKSVQRSIRKQTIHDVTEDLRIHIVDIGFEYGNRLLRNIGRSFSLCFADGDSDHIRMSVKVTRPGSVSSFFNLHSRK